MKNPSHRKAYAPRDADICMRVLPFGVRQFVPRVGPQVRLLGVVQRGLETGALALLPDGVYAQVNGDIVQPLNRAQVEAALRCAGMAFEAPRPASAGQPTVIVKRRRTLQRHAVELSD
ncbi:hypothetical protein [Delftia sp. Cs1-4]|uniref:hypothetical protein n=1 Tax=Delftia sp. (strain Cs1-4) TaxID=742013 RepID=UPI0012F493FE|nr:hypothetical protein [Delftia sp. Cs1-4]